MDNGFAKVAPHGNHFLDGIDVSEFRDICSCCHGVGEVKADKDELADYVAWLRNDGYSMVFLKKVVSIWRLHPYFPCRECDGEGKI